MSDLLTPARAVAAVKFKWQKDGDAKTYDYFIPEGMDLKPGDKVIVATKRGETTVEVVAIKAESEMAEKQILRIAEEEPKVSEGMDF
jgi:primosomal protein N'